MVTDLFTARLRPGTRKPQNLYAQLGDTPDDADPSIGWAKTEEAAQAACAAVNEGRRPRAARWWCSGALVYIGPGARLTADWVIALDSPELADRIVAAARGEVSVA